MLVGFLHRGGLGFWSYAIASEVVIQGADFVRFTKDDVNYSNQTIAGEVWENGQWVPRQTRFPDAIRNFERRNFDSKNGDHILAYRPYTIGRLVDKDDQLRMLHQHPLVASLVPQTLAVHENLDIMALVQLWGAAILKPARGRLGQGIVFIRVENGIFHVELKGKLQTMPRTEVEDLLQKLKGPDSRDYVLQQFAAGLGPNNCYYNVRVVVQKSGDGDWHTCNVPVSLLAQTDSVIANRDAGAENIDLVPFLDWRFGDQSNEIQDRLYGAAVDFSRLLDDAVAGEADELALDLAIDDNGHIWFHEGNWRGGHWLLQEDSGMYRSGGAHLVQLGDQYRAGSSIDRAEATRVAAQRRPLALSNANASTPTDSSGIVFGISLPRQSYRTATLTVTAACSGVSVISVSSAASFRAAQRALGAGLDALQEQLPQQVRPFILSRGGYCVHDPLDERGSTDQLQEDLLDSGLIDDRDFELGNSLAAGFLKKCVADNCQDLGVEQLDCFVIEGMTENLTGRVDWRERWQSAAHEMNRLKSKGVLKQWGFAIAEIDIRAAPWGTITQLVELIDSAAPACIVIDLQHNSVLDGELLGILEDLPQQIFLQLPVAPSRQREWHERHPSVSQQQLTSTLSQSKNLIIVCPTADLEDFDKALPLALQYASDKTNGASIRLRQLAQPTHPVLDARQASERNHAHYPARALAALQRLAQFDHRQIFRFFVDGRFHDRYRGWKGYEANETGSVASMLRAYSLMMQRFDLSEGLSSSYIRDIHLTCMSNVGTKNRKSTPGEVRTLEAGFNLFANTTTKASVEELLALRLGDGTAIFHAEEFYKTSEEFNAEDILAAVKQHGRLRYRPWYPTLTDDEQAALEGKSTLDEYYRVKHLIQRGFTGRVEALVARYNQDIKKAVDDDARLLAVAGFSRDLEVLHPFPDGNGRTIIGTLMHHLLLYNGFLPPILYDPNIDLELSHAEFAQEIRRGINNTETLLKNPEASLYNYAIAESSDDDIATFEGIAEDFLVQLSAFGTHPKTRILSPDTGTKEYLHLTPDKLRANCGGNWINISSASAAKLRFSSVTITPTAEQGQLLFCRELDTWQQRGVDVLARLEKAADAGVYAVVVDDLALARQLSVPALYVKDVGDALRSTARFVRDAVDCRRVVVAGSVGKTSAKVALEATLQDQVQIHAATDSGSKTPHVMTSLANLRSTDNLDITEIDIGTRPTVARYRSTMIRADICLFTSMGPVHHGDDKSMIDVIEAHAAAADGLRTGGLCLVNSSCEYSAALVTAIKNRNGAAIQTFGKSTLDQAHILNATYDAEEICWHITANILGQILNYTVVGMQQHAPIMSLGLLHATAVLGYDLEAAARQLSQAKDFFSSAKLSRINNPTKSFLLYEHYQYGGIEEICSAIDDISRISHSGKTHVVCSKLYSRSADNFTRSGQITLGERLAQAPIDTLLTVGDEMDQLAATLPHNRMSVTHLEDVATLASNWPVEIEDDDLVVLLGHRRAGLEQVSAALHVNGKIS